MLMLILISSSFNDFMLALCYYIVIVYPVIIMLLKCLHVHVMHIMLLSCMYVRVIHIMLYYVIT